MGRRINRHNEIRDMTSASIGLGYNMIIDRLDVRPGIVQSLIKRICCNVVIAPAGDVGRTGRTCPGKGGSCHMRSQSNTGQCAVADRLGQWNI